MAKRICFSNAIVNTILKPFKKASFLAVLGLGFAGTSIGQDVRPIVRPVVLQDESTSPSDIVVQEPDGDAVQLQLSDGADAQAQSNNQDAANADQAEAAPTAPAQPDPLSTDSAAPNRVRPNVSTLGNNRFSTLNRSSFYASPIAVSLGAGRGASSSSLSGYFGSAEHRNLQRTPEMFGDFRRPGSSIAFDPLAFPAGYDDDSPTSDFPAAGSIGGMRISENNVALPQDRIWVTYNHMHNAFNQPGGSLSLDRFTFGVEKTFWDESASLEFRLPIAASLDPSSNFGGATEYAGGSFGNLSVIGKRVLLASDTRVLAAGLAVETPTGSRSHALDTQNGLVEMTISPSAVYVTPYLGTLRIIDDIWFLNSFIQVDIPTSGERLIARLNGGAAQEFFINQPVVLQIDLGLGVWLITPEADRCGLALTSELHIANALSQNDTFLVDPNAALPNIFVNDNSIRNLVNYTTGLHAQLNEEWSLRAAISVPLLNERIFDTEVMVQANRDY